MQQAKLHSSLSRFICHFVAFICPIFHRISSWTAIREDGSSIFNPALNPSPIVSPLKSVSDNGGPAVCQLAHELEVYGV